MRIPQANDTLPEQYGVVKPYGECVKALMDKVYPDAPPGANRARQGVLYLPEIYWSRTAGL
ncbi:MAG: hypothetical protein H5T99_06110 [Moorella sp. (in: Bacteria)]|nr:hypothetical protein [Moorella sp. (in: firmicutes)]